MSLISNHHHVPNHNDCQTFYSCQKNPNHIGGYNAHLMECVPNTGFDVKLGICNHISKLPDCYRGNYYYKYLDEAGYFSDQRIPRSSAKSEFFKKTS